MRVLTLLGAVALVSGCASSSQWGYQKWSRQPTPPMWTQNESWVFILVGGDGQIDRSMTVRFTDEKATTCTSGDWKVLQIVREDPSRQNTFAGRAAYVLTGRALTIGLTANLCDANNELRGHITDQGFVGVQMSGGMFGEQTVGSAYGVRTVGPR
jgi:hypothetical protein